MSPPIRIRAFEPGDYAAVARINAEAAPGERQDFEPRTEGDLRELDAIFEPPRYVLRRYVAEEGETGRIVGFTHAFTMPWLFNPGWFWCAVRCEAAYRRRGIGGRLYTEVMGDLARRGATSVRMMARETMPEMVGLLERRGYREVLRSWDFILDLDPIDDELLARHGRSLVAIEPLPAVQKRDPQWLPKIRALYASVLRDVPLPGFPDPDPKAAWLADYLERWPTSLPDACFVATEGDSFLGLSVAHRNEEDASRLDQHLTGVLAEQRGRRIGVALKLASLGYARRHGYRRLWTAVESNNPRMLAINEAFGFVNTGGLILFEKAIEDAL